MMKKILFPVLALVLAVGVALPMAMPAAAHTESDPYTVDLLAGQTIDVGDVSVWNDDTNLYVTYVITASDWEITATHLYVGKNPPPTSAPGQFPYNDDDAAAITDTMVSYVIPLADIDGYHMQPNKQGKPTGVMIADGDAGVEPCDDVYIAAHAVVVQKIQECIDVVSDAGVEWSADGSTWSPAVACWVHPSWNDIAGATWVWRTVDTDVVWEYDNVPEGGWYFEKEFTIPGEPISGEIAINADNAYQLSLNGVPVGGEGAMDKDGPDGYEWATIDTFGLANLNSGLNTIEVRALNFFRTGSSTSNPAGLAFSAEVCYEAIIAEETAWSDGTTFGTNWAMYFSYDIQCVSGEVINGGFEAPVVTASQGWDIYDSGTTGLGWTVEWAGSYAGAPDPARLELQTNVSGWLPHAGDQYAELDTDWDGPVGAIKGESASVKIYQDIATCPCKTYTLTYAWSPRPGHSDNQLEVYWDGTLVATHSGSGVGESNTNWTLEEHTGLSTSGTLTRLEFIETGTPDARGMFLDAVSLVEE